VQTLKFLRLRLAESAKIRNRSDEQTNYGPNQYFERSY